MVFEHARALYSGCRYEGDVARHQRVAAHPLADARLPLLGGRARIPALHPREERLRSPNHPRPQSQSHRLVQPAPRVRRSTRNRNPRARRNQPGTRARAGARAAGGHGADHNPSQARAREEVGAHVVAQAVILIEPQSTSCCYISVLYWMQQLCCSHLFTSWRVVSMVF